MMRRPDPPTTLLTGLLLAGLVALGIWGFASGGNFAVQFPVIRPAPTHQAPPIAAPSAVAPASAAHRTPSAVKVVCPLVTRPVQDAAGLQAALTTARAGDVIVLADGLYRGQFTAKGQGTAAAPIYLCGTRGAILDGGGTGGGYVLHLDAAAYWRISGFTVRNGQKGVVADHTTASIIDNLDVSRLGDEGIHLRSVSTGNIVQHNTVHDTGLHSGKFGEGIYIGSSKSNWCVYTGCNPDRSDFNLVTANTITHTTAENVDIKEGTIGGTVSGNHFDGAGMTSADSWVDVKGNGWTITANTGTGDGIGSLVDGYQTHQILSGWGTGNAFAANIGTLRTAGYGFHFAPVDSNQVGCDNHITGPTEGQSNITCTANPTPDTTAGTTSSAATTSRHVHHHHHTS